MEVALAKAKRTFTLQLIAKTCPLGESLYSLHANVATACDVHPVTDIVF
jgi:hypothetical protein